MDIKRAGTVASRRGNAEWFSGTVWADSIVNAPAPARV
ncbi:MAG TPA: cupin domain-containing protein, partial [Bradyrhizobium sp.]|nr:cupin domain-containing protein [Bradyrhizobium sp.]